MARKSKFKPTITRVKLDPEQAVLSCSCYDSRYIQEPGPNTNWAGTNLWVNACVGVKAKVNSIRGCNNGVNAGYGQWLHVQMSSASS